MIYFQVLDRRLRVFLNTLMPRLPFKAGAGETPPGLTDHVIFYDPLIKPTRPGHILPAGLVELLEAGEIAAAEQTLMDQMGQVLKSALVEHDGELEMLTVEEEEHRARLQHIQHRRNHLNEVCEQLNASLVALKDWTARAAAQSPAPAAPADLAAPTESSAVQMSPDLSFFDRLERQVRAVMEKNGGELSKSYFDEMFQMTFDLGRAGPSAESALRPEESGGSHRVWHLSDWMVVKFSEMYQLSNIRELEEALASIRSARSDLETRMGRLQQKRREIFYSAGLNLDAELDRLFQAHHHQFELDARRRKSPFTLEDKSRYERFRDESDQLEKRVDSEVYLRFPGSAEFLSTFRRLNQAIVQSLQEWVRMEDDEREKHDVAEKLRDDFRCSTPESRWIKMQEQIQRLRQFSNLLTERGRHRPFSPVSGPHPPVGPAQVLSALDRIQSQDTTLFPEKFLRRRGPPNILMIPSFGSGLYDWQDGILVISIYPEHLQVAILAALAEFRMDADESKELFNSYGALKRYRGLGFAKLKEVFISDYTAWIEKEAAGFRVMEKEVRSWFERKIPLDSSKGAP